jgi:hypothetical protein
MTVDGADAGRGVLAIAERPGGKWDSDEASSSAQRGGGVSPYLR